MSVVGDPTTVLGKVGGPLSKAAMAAMASRYGMILNATYRDPKPCTAYLNT